MSAEITNKPEWPVTVYPHEAQTQPQARRKALAHVHKLLTLYDADGPLRVLSCTRVGCGARCGWFARVARRES